MTNTTSNPRPGLYVLLGVALAFILIVFVWPLVTEAWRFRSNRSLAAMRAGLAFAGAALLSVAANLLIRSGKRLKGLLFMLLSAPFWVWEIIGLPMPHGTRMRVSMSALECIRAGEPPGQTRSAGDVSRRWTFRIIEAQSGSTLIALPPETYVGARSSRSQRGVEPEPDPLKLTDWLAVRDWFATHHTWLDKDAPTGWLDLAQAPLPVIEIRGEREYSYPTALGRLELAGFVASEQRLWRYPVNVIAPADARTGDASFLFWLLIEKEN